MKKILSISILIMVFTISCSSEDKRLFMESCDDGTLGVGSTKYCECCFDEYQTHGYTDGYLRAIQDNCLGLLGY